MKKLVMKKSLVAVLSILMVMSLAACGNSTQGNEAEGSRSETGINVSSDGTDISAETQESKAQEGLEQTIDSGTETSANEQEGKALEDLTQSADSGSEVSLDESGETAGSSTLVTYFSLAGEQYAVGVIEEGNTSIIAHMIAEQTGADMFEIQAAEAYPQTHSELLDVSRQEMAENARPEYVGDVENWEDYDTVFIGYPNWWGDMPMIVYHFLESHDWEGKTVIPFCTHGGSGLSGTEGTIEDITGGTMMDGFAISGETAQNDRETALERVTEWLKEGGFIE